MHQVKGFFHFLSAHFISIGYGVVSCNSCTIPTDVTMTIIEISTSGKLHSLAALQLCIHSISHVWLWVASHLLVWKKKQTKNHRVIGDVLCSVWTILILTRPFSMWVALNDSSGWYLSWRTHDLKALWFTPNMYSCL